MSKFVIETKGLDKIYEGVVPVHAVKGVDLQIADDEFTAIIGRSKKSGNERLQWRPKV